MELLSKTALLLLSAIAAAQNVTQSIPPSYSLNGTTLPNPTGFASNFNLNVEDLWDLLIGPVEEASTTTTVEATPVPSSSLVPPPPLYYPPFPPGAQVAPTVKNESWSFPKDFWYGDCDNHVVIEADECKGGELQEHHTRSKVRRKMVDEVPASGIGSVIMYPITFSTIRLQTSRTTTITCTNKVTTSIDYRLRTQQLLTYVKDIARLAALGVKAYSFSISWSRIYPFGKGPVNEEGIAHYDDLINTCLEYDIIPMATLYHWDTPLVLQDTYGGWLSENIVNDFVEYARSMYGRYGDRVKYWFTVNERKQRYLSLISTKLINLQQSCSAGSIPSHITIVSTCKRSLTHSH